VVRRAIISGTGLYTPPYAISNESLVEAFNAYVARFNREHAKDIAAGTLAPLDPSSAEFIEKASGIKSRYVIEREGVLDPARMRPHFAPREDDALSLQAELCLHAAKEAMAQANKTPQDVDAVIVACANMQRAYPAMSIEVQHALGIQGFAYDLNVACSSATFGIQAACNAVESGAARAVLVINPEITSAHLNFTDRDSHFIFGDVCTAVLVEQRELCNSHDAYEVLSTRLLTQFSNNIRNNFGFMNRCEDTDPEAKDKLFIQQGRKVFKDVVPMVIKLMSEHLAENHLTANELKCMWLHQANIKMNELIARKLLGHDPSAEEAPTILDEYANTASAGSIIAFHKHRGHMGPGDHGVICSFGAGYSIGSVLIRKLLAH
jgi:beta-ketodecanoyl-[acyl-carrier-protein] synthase